VTHAPLSGLTGASTRLVRVRTPQAEALRDVLASGGHTAELRGPDVVIAFEATTEAVGRSGGTVLGPLDAVLRHLALDHPWVGPQPPLGEHLEEDLPSGLGPGVSEGPRGKSPGATPWSGAPPGGSG